MSAFWLFEAGVCFWKVEWAKLDLEEQESKEVQQTQNKWESLGRKLCYDMTQE